MATILIQTQLNWMLHISKYNSLLRHFDLPKCCRIPYICISQKHGIYVKNFFLIYLSQLNLWRIAQFWLEYLSVNFQHYLWTPCIFQWKWTVFPIHYLFHFAVHDLILTFFSILLWITLYVEEHENLNQCFCMLLTHVFLNFCCLKFVGKLTLK